jgi:hypothetical protein
MAFRLLDASVDGDCVVATRSGLHTRLDGQVLVRAWTDVDSAALDAETGELEVRWVDGTPPVRFEPGQALGRVVHERVQNSVVLAETVPVRGDRALRVAVRRDQDGTLFTQVVGNGRVDLSDPAVAGAVDAAEARLREAAGL